MPSLLHRADISDVASRHLRTELDLQRTLFRPLQPGERVGARVLFADGVHADRWSATRAAFYLFNWHSGQFEVGLSNPTPLAREVQLRSGRQTLTQALAPGAEARLAVAVSARDLMHLETTPGYVPVAHGASKDRRTLGLFLDAWDRVEIAGVFADRWTSRVAMFRLSDWRHGVFEIEASNPAPHARAVAATSSQQRVHRELAPGERRVIAIAVDTRDVVKLEISMPFVPSREGRADDPRELGVLLHPGERGWGFAEAGQDLWAIAR